MMGRPVSRGRTLRIRSSTFERSLRRVGPGMMRPPLLFLGNRRCLRDARRKVGEAKGRVSGVNKWRNVRIERSIRTEPCTESAHTIDGAETRTRIATPWIHIQRVFAWCRPGTWSVGTVARNQRCALRYKPVEFNVAHDKGVGSVDRRDSI